MFDRRHFLLAAAIGLLVPRGAARAQRMGKVTRIGVLWPVSDNAELEAFRQGLRDLGYVEGKNIALEYRFARGRDELLPGFAAELVGLDVDVILTWGVVAGRVAKKATTTIPIVNGSMSDPVRAGLVQSLARPGGNLTGLSSVNPEISVKRLELLKDLVPNLARVAVLSTANPTATFALKETEHAASAMGIRLQVVPVADATHIEGAFSIAARDDAQVIIILPDLLFIQHRGRVLELAAAHRLPAIHFNREFVGAGGFMSYASSSRGQFRRAAVYVHKILKGAKPQELPIELPTQFELAINLKTAAALGITIPAALLARADELIE